MQEAFPRGTGGITQKKEAPRGCKVKAWYGTFCQAAGATGLFRGKFGEAGPGTEAESVVSQLEPGDIIAYEIKGQIYHVAVVVGKDPRGYATIASHTADRLYFPWDLGWDESTVFWFVKISY